ncbi:MAG TPA: hypothetical protein VF487_18265 [Chitinophagaceae bacterium]
MKKLAIIIILKTIAIFSYSQMPDAVKSPDVTAFINSSFFPIEEYTGKADINIPLYTIKFGELEIPISITYNSGGVNINSTASRVGLNWTLDAGGMISKETIGQSDFYSSASYHSEEGKVIYKSFGYLSHLANNFPPVFQSGQPAEYIIIEGNRDMQPDKFFVAAPGLVTKFVHKRNGAPLELLNTASKISSVFQLPPPLDPNTPVTFEITSARGFVYTFDQPEIYFVLPELRNFPNGNPILPLTDELVDAPWPITMDTLQLKYEIASMASGYQRWINSSKELFPVIHLSTIKDPITNQTVQFQYSSNNLIDNFRRIERIFDVVGNNATLVKQINYEHDYNVEKVLTKIVFPEGVVDFYYDQNRLDIRGGKILKRIEIKNINGELVKGVLFEQDYFATPNCTEAQCYRLKLNGLKFYDSNNSYLPGYSFEYNSTALPKRYSLNQDYFGYYNGNHGLLLKNYIPKLYYKPNQTQNSYLPFSLPELGYNLFLGNSSLNSDINYARACSLEKIIFPTGGYSLLNYELNTFKFLGYEKIGGGLRLNSQNLYKAQNTLSRSILYNYNAENGSTSGTINNLPRFLYYEFPWVANQTYKINLSQSVNSRMELTNNSYVGYGRVKTEEVGNGKTVNLYTNTQDFSNIYPGTYTIPTGISPTTEQQNALNYYISDGYTPKLYRDMDVKRGKLISSSVYDNSNNLINKKINTYSYFFYDTLHEYEPVIIGPEPYNNYVVRQTPYVLYRSELYSENYLTTSSENFDYSPLTNQLIGTKEDYVYNTLKSVLKEKQFTASNGEIFKTEYKYPFDFLTETPYNMMVQKNILTPIVEQSVFKNSNSFLQSTKTNYNFWYNNTWGTNNTNSIIVPQTVESKNLNNASQINLRYHAYDEKANIVSVSKENDLKNSYIWGYNKTYPIARVANAETKDILYTSFEEADGNSLIGDSKTGKKSKTDGFNTSLSNLTNGNYILSYWQKSGGNWSLQRSTVAVTNGSYSINLSGQIDEVRFCPEKALMTTYTYTPLIGMTTECDANNRILYYYYDSFNRLILVRDQDNNIIKKICYNYAGQPETAMWEAISSTCELDGQGQTTGYELITEKDMNSCSSSYNQTRQISLYNSGACPSPTSCDCSSWGSEGWACVNFQCELGVKVVTESRNEAGTWFCTYHYEFSDGSWSGDYSIESGSPC